MKCDTDVLNSSNIFCGFCFAIFKRKEKIDWTDFFSRISEMMWIKCYVDSTWLSTALVYRTHDGSFVFIFPINTLDECYFPFLSERKFNFNKNINN